MLPEGLLKEQGLPFVHGIRSTKMVLDFCTLGSRCTPPWWSRGDLWLLSRAAREERAEPSDTGEQLFAALAEGASGSAFPQLLCAPLLLSGRLRPQSCWHGGWIRRVLLCPGWVRWLCQLSWGGTRGHLVLHSGAWGLCTCRLAVPVPVPMGGGCSSGRCCAGIDKTFYFRGVRASPVLSELQRCLLSCRGKLLWLL